MKNPAGLLIAFVASLLALPLHATVVSTCVTPAGAISCTGAFGTPEDAFTETFALAVSTAITVQTYGFGGGTNAAGTPIPAGGFDPLVALFSGPANNATLLLDGMGNPIASSDNLSGLVSPGCTPAGPVTV
ncbi:MAG: DVUA0089 family protein, partial [Acidobacteriia bacterium]|nr:DVUA0089 family protein [Terriglobia bacterium]MBV8906824.1 DVUA0089 family protein [Terriglobia bacterium]